MVVGVDVGGTKVLAAVVGRDGSPETPVQVPMPGRTVDVELLEECLTEAVHAAARGRRVDAVGLSAAGFVDAAGERVVFAPHLPWQGDPVRARLARRWGVPVALENDATCALVAEATHGAARDHDSVVLVTLGTGIGGGLLVHGRPVRGAGGMAGEYGHMTMVPDGRPCECGGRGCWEQYCSGRALLREVGRLWGTVPSPNGPSLLGEGALGAPSSLTGHAVTRAAGQGDELALAAFAEVGRWLGRGLANLVAAVDPQAVVVGGGVSDAGELLLAPARRELAARLVGGAHRQVPPVVRATTGSAAGLVGAAVLAHSLLEGGVVGR